MRFGVFAYVEEICSHTLLSRPSTAKSKKKNRNKALFLLVLKKFLFFSHFFVRYFATRV